MICRGRPRKRDKEAEPTPAPPNVMLPQTRVIDYPFIDIQLHLDIVSLYNILRDIISAKTPALG